MTGERTVAELIADAEAMPDGTRSAELAAIRQDATEDGVTVTVDVYGKLVALRLDPSAMTAGATELAQRIRNLVAKAATDATRAAAATLPGLPVTLDELMR